MKKLQRSSGGSCVSMKAGNQARFIHTLTCAAFAPLLLLAPSMVHAKVIHVNGSLNADPVADGLTWQTAFTTVREGVDATAEGDELWVAAALYLETIALKSGVALYGGFVGTETNWALRDLTNNVTILDGGQTNRVIVVQQGATNTTRIDGFTIRNGNASNGGGILCSNASPTIANNHFSSNNASALIGAGGAIYCTNSVAVITNNHFLYNTAGDGGGAIAGQDASPIIRGNVFVGNRANVGGGLRCYRSSPVVERNVFVDNRATFLGGGIECVESSPTLRNNLLIGNVAQGVDSGGGGISCFGQSGPLIIGNRLFFNQAATTTRGGGGIYCDRPVTAKILNNTFVGNRAGYSPTSEGGGGVHLEGVGTIIANNIFLSGTSDVRYTGSGANIGNNCTFTNTRTNMIAGTNGNFALDPKLIGGRTYFDVHLAEGSPCLDAGNTAAVPLGESDLDGDDRPIGAAVDVGADERGPNNSSPPAVLQFVSPQGSDDNDGFSWASAKRSVQRAIDSAVRDGPAEIWVASGVYPERIALRPFIHLSGGFSGTETNLNQRNWQMNAAVLDGNGVGPVVAASSFGDWATLDGFTIRNGRAPQGGGIYLDTSSPVIANCVIEFNVATANPTQNARGGGICTFHSSCVISNCLVRSNSATLGGGLFLGDNYPDEYRPGQRVRNCRIVDNATVVGSNQVWGGGGIYAEYCSPLIANNVISGNSTTPGSNGFSYGGGVFMTGSAAGLLVNNTITANVATRGAIYCLNARPTIANNIVAHSTSGVGFSGFNPPPTLLNNCWFNTATNSEGIPDPIGTNGNIAADPLLVSSNDPHVGANSPCINAGDNRVVQSDWLDLDGQPRILGGRVDIGADEALIAFLTVRMLGAGPAQLHLDGPPGTNYTLQATADFQRWAALGVNFGVPFDFTDSDSTNVSRRFYRALSAP